MRVLQVRTAQHAAREAEIALDAAVAKAAVEVDEMQSELLTEVVVRAAASHPANDVVSRPISNNASR